MSLEIEFSPEAKETLSAIVLFIRDQWGNKSAEKFVAKTYYRIDLISTNPYLYRALSKIVVYGLHLSLHKFLLFTKSTLIIFIFHIFGLTGSNQFPD